jgi:hypothetical protein
MGKHTISNQQESTSKSGGGFTKILNPILRNPDLTDFEVRLYGVMLSYGWQDGFCFPGQERLAKDCGCSISKVYRGLKGLEKKSLIGVRHRPLHKGVNMTNVYTFNDPLANDCDQPSSEDMDQSPVTDPESGESASLKAENPQSGFPDQSPVTDREASPVTDDEYTGDEYTEPHPTTSSFQSEVVPPSPPEGGRQKAQEKASPSAGRDAGATTSRSALALTQQKRRGRDAVNDTSTRERSASPALALLDEARALLDAGRYREAINTGGRAYAECLTGDDLDAVTDFLQPVMYDAFQSPHRRRELYARAEELCDDARSRLGLDGQGDEGDPDWTADDFLGDSDDDCDAAYLNKILEGLEGNLEAGGTDEIETDEWFENEYHDVRELA